MLTPKQHKMLLFIDDHIKRSGFAPTLAEIGGALGLSPKSKSAVHMIIAGLVERGYLMHVPGGRRSLRILRMPPGSAAEEAIDALRELTAAVEAQFGPSVAGGGGRVDLALRAANAILNRKIKR